MEKTLEEEVEELWNREQIRSLTYAYGERILRRDAAEMANLFTEDGSLDFSWLGRGIHTERDAIARHYAGTREGRIKAFFANHCIEFIDKTRARMVLARQPRDPEPRDPEPRESDGPGKICDESRLVEVDVCSVRAAWYCSSSLR
jgi:SnoaL-like domain